MKPKTIITIILLLFVGASIVYLAMGELGVKPDTKPTPVSISPTDPTASVPDSALAPATVTPATDPSTNKPSVDTSPTEKPEPVVETSPDTYIVVYYFHGNYRCITCRTIEMYTREAVNGAFLKELGNGSLHIQILNMQDPANEAYVKDFALEYYVVVLEKVVDGKRVEWKKLERVWDLRGDKDAFKKYVVSETRAYLKGINR
jgi:hypothetical protein